MCQLGGVFIHVNNTTCDKQHPFGPLRENHFLAHPNPDKHCDALQ